MLKKIITSIVTLTLVIGYFENIPTLAYSDISDDFTFDNDHYTQIDKDGNVTLIPHDELPVMPQEEIWALDELEYDIVKVVDGNKDIIGNELSQEELVDTYNELLNQPALITTEGLISYEVEVSPISTVPEYGVVIFSGSSLIYYTDANTGTAGYLHPGSAPDAAFIGMENGKIKFKQSGVTGLVSPSSYVSVVDYDTFKSQGKLVSDYSVYDGYFYHYLSSDLIDYTSKLQIGYSQSFIIPERDYFSFDGHYFYTTYYLMIDDYKANKTTNAVNPNNPYYNYYQYISHRSTTNFTSAQITPYLNARANSSSSLLNNLGSSFIDVQNTYHVNAVLMMGVAINESAWGKSSIALNTNNLFGHAAYDSDPSGSANKYSSPTASINYHASGFVNGYLNQFDYRYFGSHLGDKQSGMNVKYASDPYWGEKAAAQCYSLENYYSSQVDDYDKSTIAITSGNTYIYKDANTTTPLVSTGNGQSGTSSYLKTTDVLHSPIMILEEVQGESINGNTTWYKVRTDTALNTARTTSQHTNTYSTSRDYGYVHSSKVYLAYGDGSEKVYLTGDVNMDNSISAVDYILIRNHIMKVSLLTGTSLSIADVNKDGIISAVDYILIRNHIMGVSSLN